MTGCRSLLHRLYREETEYPLSSMRSSEMPPEVTPGGNYLRGFVGLGKSFNGLMGKWEETNVWV